MYRSNDSRREVRIFSQCRFGDPIKCLSSLQEHCISETFANDFIMGKLLLRNLDILARSKGRSKDSVVFGIGRSGSSFQYD